MAKRTESKVQKLFPDAPKPEIHAHELDDEPDEETSSSSSTAWKIRYSLGRNVGQEPFLMQSAFITTYGWF